MISYELKQREDKTEYIEMTCDGVVSYVPIDLANSDYQAYLEHETETK